MLHDSDHRIHSLNNKRQIFLLKQMQLGSFLFVLLNKTVAWLSIWSTIHFINCNKINGLWKPDARWDFCILVSFQLQPLNSFHCDATGTQSDVAAQGNKLWHNLQSNSKRILRMFSRTLLVSLKSCCPHILWLKATNLYHRQEGLALYELQAVVQRYEETRQDTPLFRTLSKKHRGTNWWPSWCHL